MACLTSAPFQSPAQGGLGNQSTITSEASINNHVLLVSGMMCIFSACVMYSGGHQIVLFVFFKPHISFYAKIKQIFREGNAYFHSPTLLFPFLSPSLSLSHSLIKYLPLAPAGPCAASPACLPFTDRSSSSRLDTDTSVVSVFGQ